MDNIKKRIGKHGDSSCVIVPSDLLKICGLERGDYITMSLKSGRKGSFLLELVRSNGKKLKK